MKKRNTLGEADSTRMRLLEAAIDCFGENGLDGTSVRDIARKAGLNFALISYHFRGKEQLYQEILRSMLLPLLQKIREDIAGAMKRRGVRRASLNPEEARALLKEILGGMLLIHLSNRKVLQLMRIMIREQTRPTEAFDIVYSNGLEEIHKSLSMLCGIATKSSPKSRETIIRTHMLLGQVIIFTAARATICRRLGHEELSKRDIHDIVSILEENIDALCRSPNQHLS